MCNCPSTPDRIDVREAACCIARRRAVARRRIEAIDRHRRAVRELDRFLELATAA